MVNLLMRLLFFPRKLKLTALLVPRLLPHLPPSSFPTYCRPFRRIQPIPPFPRRNLRATAPPAFESRRWRWCCAGPACGIWHPACHSEAARAGLARLGPRRADAKRADRVSEDGAEAERGCWSEWSWRIAQVIWESQVFKLIGEQSWKLWQSWEKSRR